MTRIPLKEGEIIQLGCYNYTISKVIGDGATCIVYSAYYFDSQNHAHKVNIKECYPHNADITRKGQALHWESQEEQETKLAAFRVAYAKLMETQNGNFTVHAFDLFESNNTLYIVMDANVGDTFDKDESETLADILKTIRLLTYVVGTYHDNGYLHLDIKPGNFLVYPRPSEHIVLFDMDTVTPIEEIRQGNINAFSYSDRWAAPEQKQGQFSKLCPATDLFAIGAVLFERIMGRPVTAADMGVFSEWKFDGELFGGVNPKIKRLLSNIFKKTLSANIKRRYQSADELLSMLDEAIKAATDPVYLTSNCPPLSTNFIGREFEILRIRQFFNEKNRAVFLSGEGGIGKSLLAQAYAKQYQQDYDVILFYRYKDSLESLIDSIAIQNFDTGAGNKREKLFSLLNERTLLIIDNFDVETDKDEFLEEVLRYEAHILFTTRTDFSVMTGDELQQLTIMQLPDPALSQLFSRASGQAIVDEEVPLLQKLLKSVDFNTYVTELLGAQMRASGCSLAAFVNMVSPGLGELGRSERILAKKDGHIFKGRMPQIIHKLFRVADLSEERKQVLRNMYLLRFLNIDRETYNEFSYITCSNVAERDALNDLLELRWIRQNGYYFTLHPLVEEIVKKELEPNEKNCEGVYCSIRDRIQDCREYDGFGEAEEDKYNHNCELLCAFFENSAPEREYDRNLMYSFLLGIIENEENASLGSPVDSCFIKLYTLLENREKEADVSIAEKMKIRYILLAAWIEAGSVVYLTDPISYTNMRVSKLEEMIALAFKTAEEFEPKKCDIAKQAIAALILSSIGKYSINVVPTAIIRRIHQEYPDVYDIPLYNKKDVGIPLSAEEQKEWEERYGDLFERDDELADVEIEREQLEAAFLEESDKLSFVKRIIANKRLSPVERAKTVSECISNLLGPLHTGGFRACWWRDTVNWEELNQVLYEEEIFLISNECDCPPEESGDWNECFDFNLIHRIYVYSMLNDVENYQAYIESLMEKAGKTIAHHLKRGEAWSSFVSPGFIYNSNLNMVFNGLMELKASWILPYLLRFAEGWEVYAKEKGYGVDDAFYPIYKSISECARLAQEEINVPAIYQQDFAEIFRNYDERARKINSTSESLRPKE